HRHPRTVDVGVDQGKVCAQSSQVEGAAVCGHCQYPSATDVGRSRSHLAAAMSLNGRSTVMLNDLRTKMWYAPNSLSQQLFVWFRGRTPPQPACGVYLLASADRWMPHGWRQRPRLRGLDAPFRGQHRRTPCATSRHCAHGAVTASSPPE